MRTPGFLTAARLFDPLAVRLALLLSVALLPLGILAIVSSLDSHDTEVRNAERTLLSLTADTQAERRALVANALSTAKALAQPLLEEIDDPVACSALLANTVLHSLEFSSIGFTGADGIMLCSSSDDPPHYLENAILRDLIAAPAPLISRSQSSPSVERPALIATLPVTGDDTLRGFLSVAIAIESPALLDSDKTEDLLASPILFNRLGKILSSGDKVDPSDLLPEGVSLADLGRRGGSRVFQGQTEAGKPAVFAVAELVPEQLYVLGLWNSTAGPIAGAGVDPRPLLFPIFMWLASIGVVYFALALLVIQHLQRLGDQMRRFALGDRVVPKPLTASASRELREVHAIFSNTVLRVASNELELAQALADKETMLLERTVLLKEVHHRVKNNLQLIASILNLQMRRLEDPRMRRVLQNVQDRVLSLATIHRSLYQSEQLSELRADFLVDELLRHLFAVGTESDQGIDLHTELAAVTLPADKLVPLSLLVTEAVTNALKYFGYPDEGGRPWLRIQLQLADNEITLTVANSLGSRTASVENEEDSYSTGLGSELITAFALQLGGDLEHGQTQDGAGSPCWELRFRFPASPGDSAEESPARVARGSDAA